MSKSLTMRLQVPYCELQISRRYLNEHLVIHQLLSITMLRGLLPFKNRQEYSVPASHLVDASLHISLVARSVKGYHEWMSLGRRLMVLIKPRSWSCTFPVGCHGLESRILNRVTSHGLASSSFGGKSAKMWIFYWWSNPNLHSVESLHHVITWGSTISSLEHLPRSAQSILTTCCSHLVL